MPFVYTALCQPQYPLAGAEAGVFPQLPANTWLQSGAKHVCDCAAMTTCALKVSLILKCFAALTASVPRRARLTDLGGVDGST